MPAFLTDKTVADREGKKEEEGLITGEVRFGIPESVRGMISADSTIDHPSFLPLSPASVHRPKKDSALKTVSQ